LNVSSECVLLYVILVHLKFFKISVHCIGVGVWVFLKSQIIWGYVVNYTLSMYKSSAFESLIAVGFWLHDVCYVWSSVLCVWCMWVAWDVCK